MFSSFQVVRLSSCQVWSLGHAEPVLFSCLCSKVTVYCRKLQCFFGTSPSPSITLSWILYNLVGQQLGAPCNGVWAAAFGSIELNQSPTHIVRYVYISFTIVVQKTEKNPAIFLLISNVVSAHLLFSCPDHWAHLSFGRCEVHVYPRCAAGVYKMLWAQNSSKKE